MAVYPALLLGFVAAAAVTKEDLLQIQAIVLNRIDEFDSRTTRRFDGVDGRLDKMNGRVGASEVKIGQIDTHLENTDANVSKIEESLKEIGQRERGWTTTQALAVGGFLLAFSGAIVGVVVWAVTHFPFKP